MAHPDEQDLQRFIEAQQDTIEQAQAELRTGRKRSHWMWFVFPQLKGLGHSAMAQRYAIASLTQARAYLTHPLLGSRLRACCDLVLHVEGRSASEIFGYPDDMKFRSCLTLFAQAEPAGAVFRACLEKYFDGEEDPATLALLKQMP